MSDQSLKDIWRKLLSAESIVLLCHQAPDPDTLGSALALGRALKKCGKAVDIVSADGVPEMCHFLPESENVLTQPSQDAYSVAVIVDAETIKRTGSIYEWVMRQPEFVSFDHHIDNGNFPGTRIANIHYSSTAEVVLELFIENDIEIDNFMAVQLLAGIVADTGGLRFSNTNTDTLKHTAFLTQRGANLSWVMREVFENRPLRALKLLGITLDRLSLECNGKVAYSYIKLDDFVQLQATDQDTDSISNFLLSTKGADLALFFRELDVNRIRVSLRSKDAVDVNALAKSFGGGGHARAAGCTINGSLEYAMAILLDEARKCLAS